MFLTTCLQEPCTLVLKTKKDWINFHFKLMWVHSSRTYFLSYCILKVLQIKYKWSYLKGWSVIKVFWLSLQKNLKWKLLFVIILNTLLLLLLALCLFMKMWVSHFTFLFISQLYNNENAKLYFLIIWTRNLKILLLILVNIATHKVIMSLFISF